MFGKKTRNTRGDFRLDIGDISGRRWALHFVSPQRSTFDPSYDYAPPLQGIINPKQIVL
ncbi:hypothetical protein [Mesorhizobium sp. B4-1-4]|uniref:hypothetical protein n=1 Tax=Mesorhizobium sp. B4-1-4 TaxID=2589888 RepID=UPI0015E36EBC|nr:hypothetical protein [Mesorhizobium sp. B4-1-4]UCI31874.1 hypothetical protein FJW03_29750 [Mesorhizobium sp. B4-1-4]